MRISGSKTVPDMLLRGARRNAFCELIQEIKKYIHKWKSERCTFFILHNLLILVSKNVLKEGQWSAGVIGHFMGLQARCQLEDVALASVAAIFEYTPSDKLSLKSQTS